MASSSTKKEVDKFMSGFKPISTLNNPDGSLPYGLYNPDTEGKLVWHCGLDPQGNVTSVFQMTFPDGRKEKECEYITDDRAKFMRDELLANGWKPIDTPNVTFKYEDGKELNRRQRKYLERKLREINKSNPFK